MLAEPLTDRMSLVATSNAAALLGQREDLRYRVGRTVGGPDDGRPHIVLATQGDVFTERPAADEARLVVIEDPEGTYDETRFDDCVFPSASRAEIVFRALRALLRKAPVPVRLQPMSLEVHGRTVPLSVTEHRLLERLLLRPGAPVTRAELLRTLGDGADNDSRALDAHIYRLRRKLCDIPGVHLETLRQRGFSLRIEDAPNEVRARGA